MTHRHLWPLAVAVGLSTWLASAARADDPKLPPPKKDTLEAVLARIRQHAAGEAWKQPGFQDDEIEKWLDKLVGSIAKATEIDDLKLPVRLKDVQPGEPQQLQGFGGRGSRIMRGTVVVCNDALWHDANVDSSIIFANGNVEVDVVRNSVIVACGVITVHGSSDTCVLVAGTMVTLDTYDGRPGREENGSVIVSRGWANLDTAYGTIVAAEKGISLTRAEGAVFVNAPVPAQRRDNRSRSVRVADLPLESFPIHSLSEKIKVQGVMHGMVKTVGLLGAPGRIAVRPAAVILQFGGRRYVADLGQPILDQSGQPVAALADWKLQVITDTMAIFGKPGANLVLSIDGK